MSMWIPPIGVRRVVIDPLVFLVACLGVLLSPIAFIWAFLADLAVQPGRWRVTRTTRLIVVFMACEIFGLTAALGLWFASGFGWRMKSARFRRANYRLLGWWVSVISSEIQSALGLRIDVPEHPPIHGPILIFSRHAGPGDSVFLAGVLLHQYRRYPRIVGKKELEFSPFFDVMGHRLPMRFIRPHPKHREVALEAVMDASSGLGERDAFVLFPEGGNFTPRRRQRVIDSFAQRGLDHDADYARSLNNVLPPHPSGPLAAIERAPTADVVFVAHTGTEDLVTPRIIWRGIPFGRRIRANYWHVAHRDIPIDHDDQVRWLDDQWRRIDRWIEEHRMITNRGESG